MLARKGGIIFLVRNERLDVRLFLRAIDDFVDDRSERGEICERDSREVKRLRENPDCFGESYLFRDIDPYLIPYLGRFLN